MIEDVELVDVSADLKQVSVRTISSQKDAAVNINVLVGTVCVVL